MKQCNKQTNPESKEKIRRMALIAMTLMIAILMLTASFVVLKHRGHKSSEMNGVCESMMENDANGKCQTDGSIPKFCFPAHQERLTEESELAAVNRTLQLLYQDYPFESFRSTISHHHFVKLASTELQDLLKQFVWNPRLIKTCFQQHKHLKEATIKDHQSHYHDLSGYELYRDPFDEIYWMRPEFDLVDQDKVHYDGVLKMTSLSQMFPFYEDARHQDHIFTVRSLTYLNSGPSAEFVALTSQQTFTTSAGTMVALDFNQELHYARMKERRNVGVTEPRIMIKAAVHLVPVGTPRWVILLYIGFHRINFFNIKSLRNLFESHQEDEEPNTESKSQDGLLKEFGATLFMAVDNMMRSLNKVHMVLPVLLFLLPVALLVRASIKHWKLVLPFLVHLGFTWSYNIQPSTAIYLRGTATVVSWTQHYLSSRRGCTLDNATQTSLFGIIVLLSSWIGVCWYQEQSAEMANRILLTQIPDPVILD